MYSYSSEARRANIKRSCIVWRQFCYVIMGATNVYINWFLNIMAILSFIQSVSQFNGKGV